MSNFKIGQKVVCVESCDYPIKGEIYTINGIYNTYALTFKEIPEYINGVKIGYHSTCFRPLDHQFAEDIIAYIKELESTPQH